MLKTGSYPINTCFLGEIQNSKVRVLLVEAPSVEANHHPRVGETAVISLELPHVLVLRLGHLFYLTRISLNTADLAFLGTDPAPFTCMCFELEAGLIMDTDCQGKLAENLYTIFGL